MNSYCFVDGGHLRAISRMTGQPLVNPRILARNIAYSGIVQGWRTFKGHKGSKRLANATAVNSELARTIYYDARPDPESETEIGAYWKAIELQPDTDIGFGTIRGRPRRQKQVDGLIAVDMLAGVFTSLFQIAILVTGDSDFVPIVEEVRRRGAMVVVAALEAMLSDELRRAADRIWPIEPDNPNDFPPLVAPDGQVWYEKPDGTVSRGSQ